MKNRILSIIVFAFLFMACNQKNKQAETSNLKQKETSSEQDACPMHPEVIGKKGEVCTKCEMELTESLEQTAKTVVVEIKPETKIEKVTSSSLDINAIINDYLKLADALVKDNSKAAAKASEILSVTLNSLNSDELDTAGKKEYVKISGIIQKDLKHITSNPNDIEHQREYFAMLSKEVNDLIKVFGANKKLYQAYCPMYKEGKSGYWISETKEIKNPYFGSKMLNCGSIIETLK